MYDEKDLRTIHDLANEALEIQNAVNLNGVVHRWGRSIKRLRELLKGEEGFSTEVLNSHPINKMWADKVAHLTGTQFSGVSYQDYMRVGDIADPAGAKMGELG